MRALFFMRGIASAGRAMRTKMSCSDGRVISKWWTARARGELLQELLRVARQPHLLELAVVVDRLRRPGCPASAAAPPAVRTRTVSKPYCAWISSSVPSSTFLPLKIMKMRSHIFSAVAMSCVLKTTVVPRRRISSTASLRDFGVDRVEAGERLVEDQELRAARRPRRRTAPSATCPSTAPRSSSRPSPACPSARHPVVDGGIELGDRASLQLPVVAEQPADGHLLVEAALLGQIADAIAGGRGVAGAEDFDARPGRAAGCA